METIIAAAVLLIGVIVWEVFKDLFHPGDRGAITDWLGRHLFNLLRQTRSGLPLAGPLTVVLAILIWVGALVVGFALVYHGSFPSGFRTSVGGIPPASPRLLQVLYFSFETLITLGYGDLMPQSMPVRFLAATEGLIGFALLTASVSSIVLLYPALSRMRLLARGVSNLVSAEHTTGLSLVRADSHEVLLELARQVTNARVDLMHFPVIYYFGVQDHKASVSHWTAHLVRFSSEGMAQERPMVRLASGALDQALDDLAEVFADRFVHAQRDDREAVFLAVARDHQVAIATS